MPRSCVLFFLLNDRPPGTVRQSMHVRNFRQKLLALALLTADNIFQIAPHIVDSRRRSHWQTRLGVERRLPID